METNSDHKHTNSLANSSSLFEATRHNPVDWVPWSDVLSKKLKKGKLSLVLTVLSLVS